MHRHPKLRGRYDKSVLSPLQWGVLLVIGYVSVLGLQIDTLRHTAFRLELFDQEVAHVRQNAQAAQHAKRVETQVYIVTSEDWPDPPIQTAWSPAPRRESALEPPSPGPLPLAED